MFTITDFFCLLVQCAGGGLVGTADTDSGMQNGLYVMAAGVLAQRKDLFLCTARAFEQRTDDDYSCCHFGLYLHAQRIYLSPCQIQESISAVRLTCMGQDLLLLLQ